MVKHRSRRRNQRGSGYSFGAAVAPETPYAQTVIGGPNLTPDCLAATRPGLAGPMQGTGGLPGFAGGMRTNLGSAGIVQSLERPMQGANVMNGGRYTVDVGAGAIAGSAGPTMGSYPVISRIGCEGGLVNTSPTGALANPTPLLQNGGVGGVDSAFYTAPTAGYSNRASDFVDSVGGPVLLQQPYDAGIMNPACLKTGGSRRRNYRRKSKKSRRSNRKTKRNNKNRR